MTTATTSTDGLQQQIERLPELRQATIDKLNPTAGIVKAMVKFQNQSQAAADASKAFRLGIQYQQGVRRISAALSRAGASDATAQKFLSRLLLTPDEFPVRQLLRVIGHHAQDVAAKEAGQRLAAVKRLAFLSRQQPLSVFKLSPSDADLARIIVTDDPAIDEARRGARFTLCTPNEDRDGERILPSGIDQTQFVLNPVALWQHGFDPWCTRPIGVWCRENGEPGWDITDEQVSGWLLFNEFPEAMELWELVRQGRLKGCSIHVMPLAYVDALESGRRVRVYTKSSAIEGSLVSVGANGEAVMRSHRLRGKA